jgi:hypothetical protein
MQWFNRHLREQDGPVTTVAKAYFEPEQLKVLDALPADAINAHVHELFVPQAAEPAIPKSLVEWKSQRDAWLTALRQKCFGGWPSESAEKVEPSQLQPVVTTSSGNVKFSVFEFDSQHDVTLPVYLLQPADKRATELSAVVLHPLDAAGWTDFAAAMPGEFATRLDSGTRDAPHEKPAWAAIQAELSGGRGLAFVAPRGIGPTAWNADPRKQTQIRRRFMLLGQTLDGMRVWDIRRAIQALRTIDGLAQVPLRLNAEREMAGIALYAALFEPKIERLELCALARSHRSGPDFLNVLRILDVPQTVAMVAEYSPLRIHQGSQDGWEYPRAVAQRLGWGERVVVETMLAGAAE